MASKVYIDLINAIIGSGMEVESRLGMTREVLGSQVALVPGDMVHRRAINYKIGWAEGLMMLAGTFDPGVLRAVAPRADHELFTANMAYGPRVDGMLGEVVEELIHHPTSRRAQVVLPSPYESVTDFPCTTSLQFLQRDLPGPEGLESGLVTIVNMRSWDAIKGLPYDTMMFGMYAQAVARCLGIVAVDMLVNAGSIHVYESDLDKRPTTIEKFFELDGTVPTDPVGIKRWATDQLRKYTDWAYEKDGVPGGITVRSVTGDPT